jgi:hypothetical protein
MGEEGQRRYLVLAMGTLAGPGPAAELLRLSRQQPSVFHFVVPTTVPEYGWTWTEGQALADATERMQIMTEFGRAMGLNIDVEVVSSDEPVEAVRQALTTASEPYHEIIVIDRPRGVRRWLASHALDELRRDPGLPLTRLEANPPMRQGKHFEVDELRQHFQEYLRRMTGGPEE